MDYKEFKDEVDRLGLSVKNAAAIINVHPVTFYKWQKKGEVPDGHHFMSLLKEYENNPDNFDLALQKPRRKDSLSSNPFVNFDQILYERRISLKAFSKIINIKYNTLYTWKKNGWSIPAQHHQAFHDFINNDKQKPKEQLPREPRKEIKVTEVKEVEKAKAATPMVALVGSAEEVLKVLSNLKLTKD